MASVARSHAAAGRLDEGSFGTQRVSLLSLGTIRFAFGFNTSKPT